MVGILISILKNIINSILKNNIEKMDMLEMLKSFDNVPKCFGRFVK